MGKVFCVENVRVLVLAFKLVFSRPVNRNSKSNLLLFYFILKKFIVTRVTNACQKCVTITVDIGTRASVISA